MKYKQVTVKVRHDETDIVSYAIIEAGSEGASVTDGEEVREILGSKKNWDYYDPSLDEIDTSAAFVSGCFGEDADISGLTDTLAKYLGRDVEVDVTVCDSVDWENEWKKYYKPIDFGALVVVPKWLDGNYDKPKILIDPGMAFGTGTHETTGMCIELLSDVELSDKSALDVGCGSGILGISALRLGARECTFIDIDPQAVCATESNLSLNGLKAEVLEGDLTDKYGGKADIVLANLTADILLRLRPALTDVMQSGGYIIISGIINSRVSDVLDGFGIDDGEFSIVRARKKGEWQAFLLKKN